MSFRDLRSLSEMMRALNYPRLMSMENFRAPNFPLVAEMLIWLVKRYDPIADLPTDIDTEQDRVLFIKSIAHFMASKANIKLNTKKLYQADGHAVKELLKVVSLLYSSIKTNSPSSMESGDDGRGLAIEFDISSRISDLKEARALATEITSRGAALYDHLAREVHLREQRSEVIARPMEIDDVERGLNASTKSVEEEIKRTVTMLENVASDEVNLDAKIDKKKLELERNQKRLQTLRSVRPAYMDEYEKLEEELKRLYVSYLTKFRNLSYLEYQVEEYQRMENDKLEEKDEMLQNLSDKLKLDDPSQMSINGFIEDGDDDDDDDVEDDKPSQRIERPVHHRVRPSAAVGDKSQIIGSMSADISDEDEESESEESDDSDIVIEGKDFIDDNSDEAIEVNPAASKMNKKDVLIDSDNDF